MGTRKQLTHLFQLCFKSSVLFSKICTVCRWWGSGFPTTSIRILNSNRPIGGGEGEEQPPAMAAAVAALLSVESEKNTSKCCRAHQSRHEKTATFSAAEVRTCRERGKLTWNVGRSEGVTSQQSTMASYSSSVQPAGCR